MSKVPRWFGRGNTRALVISSALLALVLSSSLAVAAGEGDPLIGGERNPSPNQSQDLRRETQIIANTSTYGTRQSNKSNNGGGAIYGCRSRAGGSAGNNEPCVRANNLADGFAFELETDGDVAGRIDTSGGDGTRPFTTNATGVATGLNADRVDSLSAEQLVGAARQRWALVNESGQIERQTGGFSIVNCYQANDNCYLNVGEVARDDAVIAQVVVQNVDPIAGTVLSGETGTAPCGAEFVACAPPGTEANEVVVVAPRNSAGGTDADPAGGAAEDRFRFYVVLTDSEG